MKYFLSVIAALAAIFLIIEPKVVSDAVSAAAASCLEVVVPSLFAFTVLAIYLQKSGLYRTALKPLTFPLSKLLRMDEELCAVFLLANIGGYPVGAKLLSELVNEGRLSRENAGRMLCFCFGSGPGFMIGIAGMRIFGSAGAGLVLFGACFGASLLIAGFVRSRGEIALESSAGGYRLDSETFIGSVIGGARTMFTVCAMIVGFSAISAILKAVGVHALFAGIFGSAEIFPALLEVTRIGEMTASASALPTCAALLAFGGACVIMQVAAIAAPIANRLPLRGFLISRGAAAGLSALLSLPFAGMFTPADYLDIEVIASGTATEAFSKNGALSACVLAMCGLLLLTSKHQKSR